MQQAITAPGMISGSDAMAVLNPQIYPCKLLRLVINGPAGSIAYVYIGGQQFDQTSRGQSNTAEYTNPVEVPAGTPASVKWLGVASQANTCTATFTIER